jgi:hypothetical protein
VAGLEVLHDVGEGVLDGRSAGIERAGVVSGWAGSNGTRQGLLRAMVLKNWRQSTAPRLPGSPLPFQAARASQAARTSTGCPSLAGSTGWARHIATVAARASSAL